MAFKSFGAVQSTFGGVCLPGGDQSEYTCSTRPDDDGQIATALGLPDKPVALLTSAADVQGAEYDLLDLVEGDVMASDVLLAVGFDNQIMDTHRRASF
jgi:hypothetical protein